MTTLTTEEVVKMARQAGCGHEALDLHWVCPENLEAFAKLVAAKAFQDGYSIGESAGFKEGIKLERKARGEA